MLAVGSQAPNFRLNSTPDQELSLEELRGKKVILLFYPADWSPVCSDELGLVNQALKFFETSNAIPVAISVDSKWCHLEFGKTRKYHFPLLADFEPKGAISKLYDVYDTTEGCSERAIYIIDETGIIRWTYLSPMGINPGVDGILDALDAMEN